MTVVAIINRKGGSGKSTLATQLAGYYAHCGHKVMLGDVDRQQSSLAWLRRRATQPLARRAEILGWAMDTRNARRPPPGVTHVVLDTPGGLHGLELARVVMNADLILVPVSPSAFDRESAAEALSELMRLPRVASGRCKLAVVGMRMDARSRNIAQLKQWASTHQVECLGALRDSRVYPRTAEEGLSLFDLPTTHVRTDLGQWQPLLDWVDSAHEATARTPQPAVAAATSAEVVFIADASAARTKPAEAPRLNAARLKVLPPVNPRATGTSRIPAMPSVAAPRPMLVSTAPRTSPIRPSKTSGPVASTAPSGMLRTGLGWLVTAIRSAA